MTYEELHRYKINETHLYKTFWFDIKHRLKDLLNVAYCAEELSIGFLSSLHK